MGTQYKAGLGYGVTVSEKLLTKIDAEYDDIESFLEVTFPSLVDVAGGNLWNNNVVYMIIVKDSLVETSEAVTNFEPQTHKNLSPSGVKDLEKFIEQFQVKNKPAWKLWFYVG